MGTVYRNGSYPGDYKFSGRGVLSPGYLACDGSVVSQTVYASLFAAIGTTFNIGGEGAGNFRIPDHRGRSPIGFGTGTGLSARSIGQKLGEENHTLTVPEMPSHSHGASTSSSLNNSNFDFGSGYSGAGLTPVKYNPGQSLPVSSSTSISSSGGDGSHNNMQPSLVCNILIKY